MRLIESIAIKSMSIVICGIFFGSLLYCVEQLSNPIGIKELLFWSGLILLFMSQINRGLSGLFAKRGKTEWWLHQYNYYKK